MDDAGKLVDDLKFGHIAIIDIVDQIHNAGGSYAEVKPKLRQLQTQLLNHFSKQKDVLFDALQTKFSNDRPKLKIIEFLVHDLKEIKIKTLVFIDQYPADMGDIRPQNFAKNFREFSKDLMAHIRAEREYLIPLLEEGK